jgi:ATP-dependent Clp protease adaptor protein ClpS
LLGWRLETACSAQYGMDMQVFENKYLIHCAGPEDDDRDKDRPGRTEVGVLTRTRTKTKKPAMYRVLLLNDDFTPMDFVVHVLERFFGKNRQEATEIMLHVHRRGVGVCGIYTYEVAETKVNLVMDYARKNEHPLQCTMEKE